MHILDYKRSTQLGCCALVLWTIEPLLISEVNSLPIFELLTIIFSSACAVTSIRITRKKNWSKVIKQPLNVWLAGIAGICVSDFAYIYGAKFAPIAHVDLIDYMWPCLVIIFASLLPKERLSLHHLIGGLVSALGILILIGHSQQAHVLGPHYLIGYVLAILGACLWAGYSAFSRHFNSVPTEMIGMYCGAGALISFLMHIIFETFVMPSFHELFLAIITGVASSGIAYQLWDHGIKFGNIYLLGVLTYAARMIAMALLVLFGKEPLTLNLILACILASAGVLICSLEQNTIQKLTLLLKPIFKGLAKISMLRP